MIKEFKNISPEELQVLYDEGFTVQEKLDMYYFRVEITKVGAIAMKGSTENVISDIDCITNTMFKDICNHLSPRLSLEHFHHLRKKSATLNRSPCPHPPCPQHGPTMIPFSVSMDLPIPNFL